MRYLIFETQSQGHYAEYLTYIMRYAQILKPNDEFFFVVAKALETSIESGYKSNEKFHFIFLDELVTKEEKITNGIWNYFKQSIKGCRRVTKYIHEFNIDQTILISGNRYLFGYTFFTPKNSHISVIEYIIPRRQTGPVTLSKRILYKLKMSIYAYTRQLHSIFLLNDEESVEYYNETYRTTKFLYLPDPIESNSSIINPDIKKNNKITLLHAGKFRKEKGTFDIIEALSRLDKKEKSKVKFILCGNSEVEEDNERARKAVKNLSKDMDVEFHNKYVSEDFLHKLYVESDFILIPYYNFNQSSGNLGHAASYKKPVIGPGKGLLGALIKKYDLGYTIDDLGVEGLLQVLRKIISRDRKIFHFDNYVKRCDPEYFAKLLLKG